jgi:hypothetical protein
MQRYKFSELSLEIIESLIEFAETRTGEWQPETISLNDEELIFVEYFKRRLQKEQILLLNEATVWGKAIYPLLTLVERDSISAWAQVPMSAAFKQFVVEGFVDGVVGTKKTGHLSAPFLVVVEAKKGIEAKEPQYQLYGAMLAAVRQNWEEKPEETQIIYGCYTVSDVWVFVRGEASRINDDKPALTIQTSREFVERIEAEIILGILKAITAKNE